MANSNEGETYLWKRTGPSKEDDAWDDSMLIDAYDKATKQVNKALKSHKSPVVDRKKDVRTRQSSVSNSSDTEKEPNLGARPKAPVWKIGQHCSCTYSEDGIDYEAQIIKLLSSGKSCIVRYFGYNNEEEQLFSNLKPSLGKESRQTQIEEAALDRLNSEGLEQNLVGQGDSSVDRSAKTDLNQEMPSVAGSSRKRLVPPPPTAFNDSNCPQVQEDDGLASMLMSWYMSGYHTGYYRALKLQKQSQCSKCNNADNKFTS